MCSVSVIPGHILIYICIVKYDLLGTSSFHFEF